MQVFNPSTTDTIIFYGMTIQPLEYQEISSVQERLIGESETSIRQISNGDVVICSGDKQLDCITAIKTLLGKSVETVVSNVFAMNSKKTKVIVPVNSTLRVLFKIENEDGETFQTRSYFGAFVYATGGAADDSVLVTILDKDNRLGYGENIVIKNYCDWFLSPIKQRGGVMTPDGAPSAIPVGLYVCFDFTNTSLEDELKIWINHVVGVRD